MAISITTFETQALPCSSEPIQATFFDSPHVIRPDAYPPRPNFKDKPAVKRTPVILHNMPEIPKVSIPEFLEVANCVLHPCDAHIPTNHARIDRRLFHVSSRARPTLEYPSSSEPVLPIPAISLHMSRHFSTQEPTILLERPLWRLHELPTSNLDEAASRSI